MYTSLVLYQVNGSCALVPHAVLLHFDIPVTLVPMKFGPEGVESTDGTMSHAEYLKINSKGFVPALAVDGEVITEAPAILGFISSLVPEAKLFSEEGIKRAKVSEWLNWLSGTVHGVGFGMFLRPGRFSDDPDQYHAIKTKGRELILKYFSQINHRIEGKEFIVGDSLTAVDFYLYIFSRWAKGAGFDMTQFPNYSAFALRAETIEGFQKAIKAEGLKFLYLQESLPSSL